MKAILNKEPFAKALMLMKWLHPHDFQFEPDTFIYPEHCDKIQEYIQNNPDAYFIVKPSSTSCGYGI
jgi:hypothetical protein